MEPPLTCDLFAVDVSRYGRPYIVIGRLLCFPRVIYLFIFLALFFDAEEHHPAGPLSGCQSVV